MVSSSGQLPGLRRLLAAPVLRGARLPECDNLTHPFADPSAPLADKTVCQEVSFAALPPSRARSTPVSATISVPRCERAVHCLHMQLKGNPWKKKKSSSLLRQRFKLASGKKNSIIKELIAESPRGFPDPPSLATLLDKGLWVYLRKQSLGRGWSGLADRLVQQAHFLPAEDTN